MLSWIIPKGGEAHRRNVGRKDEDELYTAGYEKFKIVRYDDPPGKPQEVREAAIYTNRTDVSIVEWNTANVELFGQRGSFRVLRGNGTQVCP